jgi:hypothetical protein
VKLLVVVVPREARDEAEAAIERAGAEGFTEIPSVYGEGSSGPRFGSRTAPEVSDLVFAAVADDRLAALREAPRAVEGRLGRRLPAFVLPVEQAWPLGSARRSGNGRQAPRLASSPGPVSRR